MSNTDFKHERFSPILASKPEGDDPTGIPVATESPHDTLFVPGPISRPNERKLNRKVHEQDFRCNRPINGDVWNYIPDWVHDSWRSSKSIPGHFIVMAQPGVSPILRWQGPDLMNMSTRVKDIFKHLKGQLGLLWAEWVEIQVAGFAPDLFPPHLVWEQTQSFHEDISAHLPDYDALGAVRLEAFYRGRRHKTPYIQILIHVRPSRFKQQLRAMTGDPQWKSE